MQIFLPGDGDRERKRKRLKDRRHAAASTTVREGMSKLCKAKASYNPQQFASSSFKGFVTHLSSDILTITSLCPSHTRAQNSILSLFCLCESYYIQVSIRIC